MTLKTIIYTAAWVVFGLCVYSFLGDQKVFEGKFENEPLGWYFLAKGIFCGLSLYMSYQVLETLKKK